VKKEAKPRDNDKIGRAFRINRTEQLAARARRSERAIERLDVVDKPWEGWELRFSIAAAERGSSVVADLADATVDHGAAFVLGPVSLTIGAGERVAITGANGAGKTTLLKVILGDLAVTSGTARLGSSVVVGRLDQSRAWFATGEPLLAAFLDEVGDTPEAARSTLAKFGLGAEHVGRPTDQLSPGERTRAALAAFQLRGVNLLVLDEPTNHLDLPAIEQLEQALDSFAGTVLVVTHDRAFLDALHLTRRVHLDAGRVTEDGPG
jgi:ATPase subunit of ABC transporter with duplicated ATPase domains